MVDNIPGFEHMSARVLFFADHYAGYWRHGDHGGHLFGTITPRRRSRQRIDNATLLPNHPASVVDPAAGEQRKK